MNDNSISLTSKVSAAGRANELTRTDSLFTDRLAMVYATHDAKNAEPSGNQQDGNSVCCVKFFLRKKIMNAALNSTGRLNFTIARLVGVHIEQIYLDIALRTRALDDIIEKNIPNLKQIVLLACGGDFRPYRLACLNSIQTPSDLVFYLIDVPHVLAYRKKCMEALDPPATSSCRVVEIGCDLVNPEWSCMLTEAGFAINESTLWIAEGFFHYLTKEEVGVLFGRIRQLTSSQETRIAFDLVSSGFQARTHRTANGGLFQFAVDDPNTVQQVFHDFGCSDIDCVSFQDLGAKYNRPVSKDRSFVVEARVNGTEH